MTQYFPKAESFSAFTHRCWFTGSPAGVLAVSPLPANSCQGSVGREAQGKHF